MEIQICAGNIVHSKQLCSVALNLLRDTVVNLVQNFVFQWGRSAVTSKAKVKKGLHNSERQHKTKETKHELTYEVKQQQFCKVGKSETQKQTEPLDNRRNEIDSAERREFSEFVQQKKMQ